jgi:hypothetical protein
MVTGALQLHPQSIAIATETTVAVGRVFDSATGEELSVIAPGSVLRAITSPGAGLSTLIP